MTPKRDFLELLGVVGISAAGSILFGLAMANFHRPQMPFEVAVWGYAVGWGSIMVALPLGEGLDLERRRGSKRWDMIGVLAICAALLMLLGHLVGLNTPPLVGQSDNSVLFPGFVLIGLMGGVLTSRERFRRK